MIDRMHNLSLKCPKIFSEMLFCVNIFFCKINANRAEIEYKTKKKHSFGLFINIILTSDNLVIAENLKP